MAHFDVDPGAERITLAPHDETRWLGAAAAVGGFVNDVAMRGDLVGKVGPGIGRGAPACFIPSIAEVEVDSTVCMPGADPATVDLGDEIFRMRYPQFVGAIVHEAAHAKHSHLVPATWETRYGLPRRVIDVIMLLEETRIEAKILRTRPEMQIFLRATAHDIVAKDFRIADTPYGAAGGAALLLGRVDAGSLEERDVAGIRDLISTVIPDDLLAQLRALWIEFQGLMEGADDWRMIEIAREWLRLLEVDEDSPADDTVCIFVESDGSEDGEGEGEGEGEGPESESRGAGGGTPEGGDAGKGDGTLGKALKEASAEASTDVDTEIAHVRREKIEDRDIQDRRAEAKRQREAEEAAGVVFRRGGSHGASPVLASHHRGDRDPSGAERAAAVRIGTMLDRVKYQDRVVQRAAAILPPGRFRGRGAVQAAAEQARGAMVKSAAWQTKKKHHTDEPPLTVGIMTDISGSMGAAEAPMASATWILSEAVRRVHGKVASVLFGSIVHSVVAPGERMPKVREYAAMDGTEQFAKAFKALDGALDLLNSPGARLLIIASDAQFVNPRDDEYARTAMRLCRERGVAVIWLNIGGYAASFGGNHGWGEVVEVKRDVTAAADVIGKTAVEAIRKAGMLAR